MENFIIILLLIFGILQIILFFKIWNMCNNVKMITRKPNCKVEAKDLNKALLIGDKNNALKLLTDAAIDELLDVIDEADPYIQERMLGKMNEKYSKIFSNLGVEMPDPLKRLTTVSEIRDWYQNRYKL